MWKNRKWVFVSLVMLIGCLFFGGIIVQATETVEGAGEPTVTDTESTEGGLKQSTSVVDDISPLFEASRPDFERGAAKAKGVSDGMNKVTGFIIAIAISLIPLFTALDLFTLLVPPVREFVSGETGGRRWISSECLDVLMEFDLGGGVRQASARPYGQIPGMNPAGGMGMGMGMNPYNRMGYPGNQMGSPMGQFGGQQQQQTKRGNRYGTYLKKRGYSLVLVVVCILILFSNVPALLGVKLSGALIAVFNYMAGFLSF